eukprot:PhF_6_TR7997/c1_g1_i3/m.12320
MTRYVQRFSSANIREYVAKYVTIDVLSDFGFLNQEGKGSLVKSIAKTLIESRPDQESREREKRVKAVESVSQKYGLLTARSSESLPHPSMDNALEAVFVVFHNVWQRVEELRDLLDTPFILH